MLKSLDPSITQRENTLIINLQTKGAVGVASAELHDLFAHKVLGETKPFVATLQKINELQKQSITLDTETIDTIVFDMTNLSYITSSALIPFLKANMFLSRNGSKSRVILLNPTEKIKKTFELSKLIDGNNNSGIFSIQYGTPENMSDTLQSSAE